MLDGFRLLPAYFDADQQAALVAEVLWLETETPFYQPRTPNGGQMSVSMFNLGPLGWVTDERGYRYQSTHPVTGKPWPAIPEALISLWNAVGSAEAQPDACLVNLYRDKAKMGLHQDADEADFRHPVVSISLGDTAVFRLGGASRRDPTRSFRLSSGDVVVLGGDARRAFHGVDRIIPGSSRLIPGGGRINLTLRRAAP